MRLRNEKFILEFGQNLRKIRKSRNLSYDALAYEVEPSITKAQLIRIEQGKVNPTISTIKAIATALDLKAQDLFDFEK